MSGRKKVHNNTSLFKCISKSIFTEICVAVSKNILKLSFVKNLPLEY